MINDVDEAIKQLLLKEKAIDPADVDISFDAPDKEWSSSISKPTVNIYLYDVRENHQLRSFEWTVERNRDRTATRKKAPLRGDLSYLITAWTKHVEDEHRLLGRLMVILSRHQILPEDVLQGVLKGLEYPIHASTAQPDGLLKNPADFWGALDNKIKPSINYVLTIPVDLEVTFTAPMVWTKTVEFKELDKPEPEELVQILGKVHEQGKPDQGIAQVKVIVKEAGMTATTDESGKYSFRNLQRGTYTFKVVAQGRPAKELKVFIPSENYEIEL